MTTTVDNLREYLKLVNAARAAAKLTPLVMVNSIEPPGIALMGSTADNALKPIHEHPMNRKQAECFLSGALSVLSDLGD